MKAREKMSRTSFQRQPQQANAFFVKVSRLDLAGGQRIMQELPQNFYPAFLLKKRFRNLINPAITLKKA